MILIDINRKDNIAFMVNALFSGESHSEIEALINKLSPILWKAEDEKDRLSDIAETEDTDEAYNAYDEAYKRYKNMSDYINGIELLNGYNRSSPTCQIDEAIDCAKALESEYGINFYNLFK